MNDKLLFLKTVKPFDGLPDHLLEEVAGLLKEVRYAREAVIYLQEVSRMEGVDIIVDGTYEVFFYDSAQNKRLAESYSRGFCYGGYSILLNKKRSIRTVVAKKGTRVYTLARQDFKGLCEGNEGFLQYFTTAYGKRMLNDEYAHFVKTSFSGQGNYTTSDQFYSRRIETVEVRDIIACAADTAIYEAAALMSKAKVSCLFVKGEGGQITGYVTDITLRDNVLARQVDTHSPIREVMDAPIVSITSDAFVYEAILLMFRTKTRYLLIEKEGVYTGFISRNKLLSDQAQSPFMFIQSVKLALSVEELRRKWQKVPEIVHQLLERGVKAEIVNQVITAVSDTIALKVIEEVVAEVGEPPARFVFMVLGSEGRKEQTLKTDQDNAIIYEDKANEQRELVRAYFLKFAALVSERLDYVGFSFCEGGFMAKNPKWAHSLSHWKRNYANWMTESNPETVMKFSTFFDCRYLYGEAGIMEELKDFLKKELQSKSLDLFLYHMANNALQYEPPLTFFNNIKTFSKGSQQVFNLKKTMTPMVDLVRVYALKHRIFTTNTGERIAALQEMGVFQEKECRELLQSYYYLMSMRLRKQAVQIIDDKSEPDNYLDPTQLTKVERVTLKEIFKVIEGFQQRIKLVFTRSM